jgi:serine/threonine protein kinase
VTAVTGYTIERELGRGGMGVVYLAWQHAPWRPVALKLVLAGAHAGPAALDRFRLEGEAIARLRHPGIVRVYAVGEAGGLPYMALEYVDGPTLRGARRRPRRGPPPSWSAVSPRRSGAPTTGGSCTGI